MHARLPVFFRDWDTSGALPLKPCLRDIVPQTPFFASRRLQAAFAFIPP